jgi:hypothetical protein
MARRSSIRLKLGLKVSPPTVSPDVLEVGTRRILHWNVTGHPTAAWTIQQFRAVITPETSHRSSSTIETASIRRRADYALSSMGRHVLKTPARTPQANAFCERLIGTIRRECRDWLMPIHEAHLRPTGPS